jgi:uncharacterized phage protein (TIGR01671 family)
MRPIKFLCFDKESKQWIQYFQINQDGDPGHTDYDGNHYKVDEYVLTQFTGLHDRNGKEIFEGDIVKFEDWLPKEVAWLDKIAGYELKGTLLWLSQNDASKMEVIGSVHENPELLETK